MRYGSRNVDTNTNYRFKDTCTQNRYVNYMTNHTVKFSGSDSLLEGKFVTGLLKNTKLPASSWV
jgi:hypothetical protein